MMSSQKLLWSVSVAALLHGCVSGQGVTEGVPVERGRTNPTLEEALIDGRFLVVKRALSHRAIHEGASAIPALVEVVEFDHSLRGQLGIQSGDGRSVQLRSKAAYVLSCMCPEAIVPLVRLLEHPDDKVRWYAADALGKMALQLHVVDRKFARRSLKVAVEPLARALSDSDAIASRAAWALGMIGPDAEAAIDELAGALEREPYVRDMVLLALREVGPLAREALPGVRKVLAESPDDSWALGALQSIDR